jgi:ApeA N-terminal domain 1
VRAKEPLPLTHVLESFVDPFVNFLVLGLGEQARIEGMTVTRYEPVGGFVRASLPPGRTHLPRDVRLYQRPWPRLRRGRPNYRPQLMVPRRALGNRAETVLRRWWDLMRELDPAHTMLFGVWNAHSIYIENSLLNLTSFAEGYHERRHDEPRLDPAQHKRLVRQLVRPLPKDIRRIYRESLAHAYRQTQNDRLTELVERAAFWLPAIAPEPGTLVKQLIATRNHLTHWGPKTQDVLDDHDLWEAVERLSAVLRVNLLLDLGMEPDAIEYGFYSRYGGLDIFRRSA